MVELKQLVWQLADGVSGLNMIDATRPPAFIPRLIEHWRKDRYGAKMRLSEISDTEID